MALNSDQLEAFFYVAKLRNFSKAAKALALSQPALSLRIKKLEETLRTSLFVRESSGILLTAAGEKVLRHWGARQIIEEHLLEDLSAETSKDTHALNGIIRIAGFSTVTRSILVPALDALVLEHPQIQLDIKVKEMHELPSTLRASEADFTLTDKPIASESVENQLLGHEENVLVEAKSISSDRQSVYFDNDLEDQSTIAFFRTQGAQQDRPLNRSYLDEVYTIIEAVERGWGRAVLPKHLIQSNSKLRLIPKFKALKSPVYLNFFRQPFCYRLHDFVKESILREFRTRLR